MAQSELRTQRKLADGWLGATHVAVDTAVSTQLVAKSIQSQFLRSETARAQLAALCRSLARPPAAGIVPPLSCVEQPDGSVLLTMPFRDAEDLRQLVARAPAEAAQHSVWIVRETALLLDAGQRAGHRHLALRPSQILIARSPGREPGIAVHLVGLGLSEALGLQRPRGTSESHRIFLAPEQTAAADAAIGGSADVYALGVLLVYLSSGRLPSPREIEALRANDETLSEPRLAREDTKRLVKRMLAIAPSQRPTLAEVVQALGIEAQAALMGETMAAPGEPAARIPANELAATLAPPDSADAPPAAADALAATLAPPEEDAFAATEAGGPPAAAGRPITRPDGSGSSNQLNGLLFGNFRIVRRIGQGGMGVVYEAEHRKIGRRAAIKVLHPRFAQTPDYANRFLNEARAVNIIQHPGLVEIFEYGRQPDGTLYIVMEYLQGESLRSRLDHEKGLPTVDQVLAWSVQIARALTATHEKGIIHRDLKPENIMVVSDPLRPGQDWVKLLDFGIAKVEPSSTKSAETSEQSDDGFGPATETTAGTVMGTPVYMAPEQHAGAEVVDGRADVFAFGVMIYEMLAGKRPYKDTALSLRTAPAAPITSVRREVPKKLAVLLPRMLALAPAERPTMADVATHLAALVEQRAKPQRSRLFPIVAGIVVVLLAVSSVISYRLLRPLSLAEARERALTVVKKSLPSVDAAEGLWATQALGKSRDIEYRPLLEPLLAAPRPAMVGAAARGLGEMSAVESQAALLALLAKSAEPGVRMEAAFALALLSHPTGTEVLRSLVQSTDDLTKVEAALRLLELGDHTGAPLLHKIADRDELPPERTLPVLAALARAGDQLARQRLAQRFQRALTAGSMEPLLAFSVARLGDAEAHRQLAQLAQQPGREQVVAARLLAALGQPAGYRVLLENGGSPEVPAAVREVAFEGLGDSGQAEAAGTLARTLSESAITNRLRLSAAGAILQLAAGAAGSYANCSLSWARAALGSDSSATRELAVMLLGDLETDESIPPLRLALQDKEPEVRSGAARALGRKSVRAALEALTDVLADSAEDVRAAGMKSMGQVVAALRKKGDRSVDADALARLRGMAQKGTAVDRVVAAGILFKLGDDSQISLLRDGLSAAAVLVRRLAVELAPPDPALLLTALGDVEREVRFAAARRLAELGQRESLPVLRVVLGEGGLDGLIAFALLRKLGEAVEPPAALGRLFADRSLHQKELILDALAELPAAVALEILLAAARDASNMIRRRAGEVAFAFYARTLASAFRNLLLELRNDVDIVVRARASELATRLPAVPGAGSRPAQEVSVPIISSVEKSAPPVTPPDPAKESAPPTESKAVKATAKAPPPGKPSKKPGTAAAAPGGKAAEDPRAKTMGRIQIYVMKNGRCQLANQYFLPPGDHIINVDGGQSRTVSVYAGTTIPIRQCP